MGLPETTYRQGVMKRSARRDSSENGRRLHLIVTCLESKYTFIIHLQEDNTLGVGSHAVLPVLALCLFLFPLFIGFPVLYPFELSVCVHCSQSSLPPTPPPFSLSFFLSLSLSYLSSEDASHIRHPGQTFSRSNLVRCYSVEHPGQLIWSKH